MGQYPESNISCIPLDTAFLWQALYALLSVLYKLTSISAGL